MSLVQQKDGALKWFGFGTIALWRVLPERGREGFLQSCSKWPGVGLCTQFLVDGHCFLKGCAMMFGFPLWNGWHMYTMFWPCHIWVSSNLFYYYYDNDYYRCIGYHKQYYHHHHLQYKLILRIFGCNYSCVLLQYLRVEIHPTDYNYIYVCVIVCDCSSLPSEWQSKVSCVQAKICVVINA